MMKLIGLLSILFLMTASLIQEGDKLKVQVNLIGDSGYQPNAIPDMRNSTLVFLFTSYFKNDSIEIIVDSISKKLLLSTDSSTGSATTVIWGKLINPQEVILKLNNNKPIKILANSTNQLFVIKYLSNTLKVESVYHLPRLE